MCYPAILTNTLVPQPGLSSILQKQLAVALDTLTVDLQLKWKTNYAPNCEVSVDLQLGQL